LSQRCCGTPIPKTRDPFLKNSWPQNGWAETNPEVFWGTAGPKSRCISGSIVEWSHYYLGNGWAEIPMGFGDRLGRSPQSMR
jgi:hypothetical protein